MATTPEIFLDLKLTLGESLVWDSESQSLYFVDIEGKKFFAFDWNTQNLTQYDLPFRVGCIAVRENGGFVLGGEDGIYFFSPGSENPLEKLPTSPDLPEGIRFNDGRSDQQGRFILTCSPLILTPNSPCISPVYRLDHDLSVSRLFDFPVCIGNGTAFSPDGTIMYFTDSMTKDILKFDYDITTGTVSNRQVFTTIQEPHFGDGAIVDSAGYLWSACFNGSRVVRYAPDGTIDRIIHLPVTNVTCVAFGGPDLRLLFITTARELRTEEQLAAEPYAGGVFVVQLDVPGIPGQRFRG
jgi:L-arabinonolactonase